MSEELRKNLVIGGVRYSIAVGQSGAGAPTTATPGKVGVTYLDTNKNVLYACTAADVENGAYTWVMVTGLYYTTTVTQPTENTIKFEQKPNISGIPIPNPVTVTLPTKFETLKIGAASEDGVYIQSGGTAEAPALDLYGENGDEPVRLRNLAEAVDDSDAPTLAQVREMVGNGSGADATGGLTTAQVNALDGMFRIAKYESDPTDAYAAFCTAFGITAKTLESITATYTGGEVAVGTALADLTGITVTAVYSDGSTAAVTGYTLSGEIAEGSNTITVTYGGKTAAITVVGVASGEDEPAEPLYGIFWPPKGKVIDWNNVTWDDVDNYAYTGNTGTEYVTAGLPAGACVRLDKLTGTVYIRALTNNQYGIIEQGCYQVYANSDGEIATGGFAKIPHTIYRQFGGKAQTMEVDGVTYYFTLFKFEIPAGQVGYFVSTQSAMKEGYFVSSDLTGIDDAYKPYYTLFGFDPSDRITEPATEVA